MSMFLFKRILPFLTFQRMSGSTTEVLNTLFKDEAAKTIVFQFQCVTWKLEKLLSKLPYDRLDISEEVREQVKFE